MTDFTIHTQETAPDAAKELLAGVQKKFGMIPNLMGEMAEAPNVLKGYLDLAANTGAGTLNATELQTIQITTSRIQGCEYCVAAHSTVAKGQKVPQDVLDAIRSGGKITDAKLQALHDFTIAINEKEGWASDTDVKAFLSAGYTKGQVLEVVMSVALKLFTNYANHILHTPVDAAFQPEKVKLNACGSGCGCGEKMAS